MSLTLSAAPLPAARPPLALRVLLRGLACGSLTLVLPSGRRIDHAAPQPGPHGVLELHAPGALRRLLVGGDVGFAEAYIAGAWSSPDLVALLELAGANICALDRVLSGFAVVRLWRRLAHAARRNSPRGSRRNIAAHYDLGNAFYALWLDRSMTYSAARTLLPGQSLEAAQAEKRARIAELLATGPGEQVLEIGCGWGALALDLARTGASVTGITLSREQLAWAQQAQAETAPQPGSVDLRLQDYRAVEGRFDCIVSIEMAEAVGEAYWPTYFATLRKTLAPGGRAVLQIITIREDRFESYRRSPDFIQSAIFPGGMLLTNAIIDAQARLAGLAVTHRETFGAGYAATLAAWRERFDAAWEAVAGLGFPPRFHRLWTYYLAYCEAGFRTGLIDVGLYVLEPRA